MFEKKNKIRKNTHHKIIQVLQSNIVPNLSNWNGAIDYNYSLQVYNIITIMTINKLRLCKIFYGKQMKINKQ